MGRHEPPTNRSFYLSVAASTLRFAIIVALVVGGVVVINQAFPESTGGADTGALPDDGGIEVTESPSPSPSETEPPEDTGTPSPVVTGVVIVVLNAAGVDGLAGDTTTTLVEEYGYEAMEPGTAPSLQSNTTIYYAKRKDKIEAEYLANDFFRRIEETVRVAPLPDDQDLDESVQLAIYIGTDYAAIA
jgi:hypothetical protein